MAQKDYRAERQDYKTPASIYKPLLQLLDIETFHIDVCCSECNIPSYFHYIDGKTNGLTANWHGYCFMNPPFKYTKLWIKKAVEESSNNGAVVVSVIPADRLETQYYQKYVLGNPNCLFAFLPDKQGFIIPGQESEEIKPSQKIMIAIFTSNKSDIEIIKDLWHIKEPFNTPIFRGGGIR